RPALILVTAVAAQIAVLAWGVPALGALGAALSSAGASALACVLLIWQGRHLGVTVPRLGKQALALGMLGLVILPLALFFAGAARPFVACWIAGAALLYLVCCLVLNLLNVTMLTMLSGLPGGGRVGRAVARVIHLAGTLN